jgi:DNA polymerase-4
MCPELIVVPSAHGRYGDISAKVFSVFRSYTPLVEGMSLDEAFLDVSGLRRHYRSSIEVGKAVRMSMRNKLGLPASVGVASTKFIAKLASEAAKPDGLRHIADTDQLGFLHPLHVKVLPGVGPATLAGLKKLGIETVGDIAELPVASLTATLGPALGHHLHNLASGRDPRPVVPDIGAKSISVEQTYETDLIGREVLEASLLSHAQRLSGRLRRSGLSARTVTLKVRYDDFTTPTRSQTLDGAVAGARDLYRVATDLLGHLDLSRPVRLLGLGASSLEPSDAPIQLDLESSDEWARVEEAGAAVKDRFGDSAVSPARLIEGRDNEDPS